MAIIILSLALSLDSLMAGFSYGVKKVVIPPLSCLIFAACTYLYTGAAILLGGRLAPMLPKWAGSLAGMSVLLCMGLWSIKNALTSNDSEAEEPDPIPASKPGEQKARSFTLKSLGLTISIIRDPSLCDFDDSKRISVREALFLSFALCADSLTAGLGSAMLGISSPLVPLFVATLSSAFLLFGKRCGRMLAGKRTGLFFRLLPGALLILAGVLKLVLS